MKHNDPRFNAEIFKTDPADIFGQLKQNDLTEQEARRLRLMQDLASILKRLQNERIALEDMLTERGILDLSGSLYAFDWYKLWKIAEQRQHAWNRMGYWQRLWHALRGRGLPSILL